MLFAGRQQHQVAGPQLAHAAVHHQFHLALQAVDGAFVGHVVLRLVLVRRQHHVQQLDAPGLDQAGAHGALELLAQGRDIDDVQGLCVR